MSSKPLTAKDAKDAKEKLKTETENFPNIL